VFDPMGGKDPIQHKVIDAVIGDILNSDHVFDVM
jgi:hypothetical protein